MRLNLGVKWGQRITKTTLQRIAANGEVTENLPKWLKNREN
jgi:hypothetical protein